MANFQYFVHRTAGLVANISSAPTNLPEGGFYQLELATDFARLIADHLNVTSVYDKGGARVVSVPRKAK